MLKNQIAFLLSKVCMNIYCYNMNTNLIWIRLIVRVFLLNEMFYFNYSGLLYLQLM